MAIVTFYGSGKEQVGKTLAAVAIATNMAIEHNKRILIISASYNNETIKSCYWNQLNIKKSALFAPEAGVELDNGIEGLAKIFQSNKITPNLITDYTKTVFKDRLEVLLGFEGKTTLNGEQIGKIYSQLVELANQYYDMVFVDLDNEINIQGTEEILKISDLVVMMAAQKLLSVKAVQSKMEKIPAANKMLLIGRYDKASKYTLKNLTRMIGARKEILAIPYNTLYFEAAQDGTVTDLFLRLRRLEDKTDGNIFFIESVKKVSEQILKRIEEDKMNMQEGR